MNKTELRNTIRKNQLQVAEVLDLIKAEKREMSSVEKLTVDNLTADNTELTKQLDVVETEARQATAKVINDNTEERFSFVKSIREIAEGNLESVQHPFIQRGMAQMRKSGFSNLGQLVIPVGESYESRTNNINAGTTSYGAEAIQTDVWNLMPALRANTVLMDAGAQFLTGLVNNGSIPLYAGSSAVWAAENGAATSGSSTFSKVSITPHRITGFIDVSKRFLIQDNIGAEAILIADIQRAIVVLLEKTILGTAAGSTTQPAGIFNGASYDFTGTTTWAGLVAMESALLVKNKNLNNKGVSYVLAPNANGLTKTTAKASNQAIFIQSDNKTINGYPVFVTSNLGLINSNEYAAVLADFSDLVVAQWSGIDITVDPYTQMANGNIRIVYNAYYDAAFRRGSVSYSLAGLK